MVRTLTNSLVVMAVMAVCAGAQGVLAADAGDARNFLAVATGSVASSDDPRILEVHRQLELIEAACSRTSRGAGFHDKLGKGSSMVNAKVPLLVLLSDFTRIAAAQCGIVDDGTLISLYVLERNSGRSHASTVTALRNNPKAVIAKWSSR
jgi:hypothetical protein